jgi:hypothetical protein
MKRALLTISGIVALLMVASPAYAPPPAPPVLDHFKCYPMGDTTPVNEFVSLHDQFSPPPPSSGSPGILESVVVDRGVIFCNPVEKTDSRGNVTKISNPNNHLKMYRFHPNVPNQHALTISNQFGGQNVTISAPVLLAVPTQKDSLPPPSGLDHFRCYPAIVTPGAVNQPTFPIDVTLKDQFDKQPERVQVLGVVAFCAPADKLHNGQITTAQDQDDHLTCYGIEETTTAPVASPVRVFTQNQFGKEKFFVTQARYLCVPTLKQVPS